MKKVEKGSTLNWAHTGNLYLLKYPVHMLPDYVPQTDVPHVSSASIWAGPMQRLHADDELCARR